MRMNEFIEHVNRDDQPKAVEAPSETLDLNNDDLKDIPGMPKDHFTDTTDHKTSTSDLDDLIKKHVSFKGSVINTLYGNSMISRNGCGCNNACANGCSNGCSSARAESIK